jgi:hypothetical protein
VKLQHQEYSPTALIVSPPNATARKRRYNWR